MDYFLWFIVVSFIFCLPLIFIGSRKIMDITILDLIAIIVFSILPYTNIIVVLILYRNYYNKLFDIVLFKKG